MLYIACPWCGPREEPEFVCGGATDPAERTGGTVYGRHGELWLHRYGCRRWFVLERDTARGTVHGARAVGDGEGGR